MPGFARRWAVSSGSRRVAPGSPDLVLPALQRFGSALASRYEAPGLNTRVKFSGPSRPRRTATIKRAPSNRKPASTRIVPTLGGAAPMRHHLGVQLWVTTAEPAEVLLDRRTYRDAMLTP